MAELDAELLERVAHWCAEAGRQAPQAQIRRALAPLSWDELLALRALLADPPPARPLGPFALADLARGAPADVAAERERGGRYASAEQDAGGEARPAPEAPRPARSSPRPRGRARGGAPIIRRARDVAPAAPPAAPVRPLVEELLLPEGRGVLERLVRRTGPSRPALLAALTGWRRPDDAAPTDEDLDRLLAHHGMARAFARRERDGLLHAVRAAGGIRTAAAARLGLELEALDAAIARLGAGGEVERIREARRTELRARATLSARLRLVLDEESRLRDLELLGELEEDLRRRLPEHVRALSASRGPLEPALARSLSLTPVEAQAVTGRFGLALGAPTPSRDAAAPRPPGTPAGRPPARRGGDRPLHLSPGSPRPGRPGRQGTGARQEGPSRPGAPGRQGGGPRKPGPSRAGTPGRQGADPRRPAGARRRPPPGRRER